MGSHSAKPSHVSPLWFGWSTTMYGTSLGSPVQSSKIKHRALQGASRLILRERLCTVRTRRPMMGQLSSDHPEHPAPPGEHVSTGTGGGLFAVRPWQTLWRCGL